MKGKSHSEGGKGPSRYFVPAEQQRSEPGAIEAKPMASLVFMIGSQMPVHQETEAKALSECAGSQAGKDGREK